MRNLIILMLTGIISACSSSKLSVPPSFSSQATKMKVEGLNGWMTNQKLSFGPYETSRVKRGWDFASSFQYTKFQVRPEEALLKVFNIDNDNKNKKQKNKFQYALFQGNDVAEIYAAEQFSESQLVYKSNNPYIGSASKTKKYEYAFVAGIVPVTLKNSSPWSLVLINTYDVKNDTARRLFDRPYVEEEGYATNGDQSIAIRPLRMDTVSTKKDKEVKVWGGDLLSGYELSMNNEPVCMIDILENAVWIKNDASADEKFIFSSIASAILLKRLKDIDKDKTEL